MPLSRSRDYLSIGELLDAVRPEFPDVTISKIRFLESEGLIEPERTESGYRKFYEKDVERLRFILTLQRDHFLPLKVIRERIDSGASAPTNGVAAAIEPIPEPPVDSSVAPDMGGVQLDRAEFLRATGLTEAQLTGLVEFGIITGREEDRYDEVDLMIGKAAKGFLEVGVEPRHLRMYRQFADREAGLFEQLIGPAAARKDAEAGRDAAETFRRLTTLSRSIREGIARDVARVVNR
ncbi:MAG: MerR family transcriptional regulator [Actinomycetota bacterium]